ncbi:MAG: hypothetical protein R3247_06695 [Rhodothermales bacterium]|nr:hypothetical protein [Rhodothermales bacterium]
MPGDAIAYAMARRSLGGASTYRGLISRHLEHLADAVDEAILRALVEGHSARRLALTIAQALAAGSPEVEQLVTNGRLRSGLRSQPDPAAQQLLRSARRFIRYGQMIAVSEINESYRAAHILSAAESPAVEAARWRLSGRHRGLASSPCACDVLAELDLHGLGAGVYALGAYPAAPHPYCACTPEFILRAPGRWDEPKPELEAPPRAATPEEVRMLFRGLRGRSRGQAPTSRAAERAAERAAGAAGETLRLAYEAQLEAQRGAPTPG